jgi:hypothetical protein
MCTNQGTCGVSTAPESKTRDTIPDTLVDANRDQKITGNQPASIKPNPLVRVHKLNP